MTGAGSGIGEGIAKRYAKEGASLFVTDLNLAAAQKVASHINDNGGKARALQVDVTKEQQVDAAVQQLVDELGKIDIMVVNAGVQHIEPIVDLSFDNWRKVVSVHLDAAFLCTRAALRQMYPKKKGSVVYIGSVHSKSASLLKAPYVSAKHGIMGLCRSVAKEGAMYNVRANVICPGFVLTPLVTKQIPEQAKTLGISEDDVVKKVMLKDTVDGQFTTIEDIAELAVFFAGFETNALTGQSLIASHGWVME